MTLLLHHGTAGQRLETVGLLKQEDKHDRVDVRLVAPAMYRPQFLPEGHVVDSATHVVASLATASQVQVSQLTG